MGIGDKLNILLQKRERNINELASTINVSPNTLYSIIKRNNTKVDLDILQKIADELSVTLDYFCSDYKNTDGDTLILKDIEKKIILAYREHPEMQAAINKMLDIDSSSIQHYSLLAAKGHGMQKKIITEEQQKKAAMALHNIKHTDNN